MTAQPALPAHNPQSACPKCGAWLKTKWHPGPEGPGWPCGRSGPRGIGEHLCRTCSVCGWGCVEATEDAAADGVVKR